MDRFALSRLPTAEILPLTSMAVTSMPVAQASVIIVSDSIGLAMSLEVVCDFLDIALEHVSSREDIGTLLLARRPMAVVAEADGGWQDGFHVMKTVAGYDPGLPVMVLTGGDPRLEGAVAAVQDSWCLTTVATMGETLQIGELVDFFCRAGRRAGCLRLLPV